jgi:hypothetical protein
MNESMNLPDGETCIQCKHFVHCSRMYGVKAENTACDFYPVRFVKFELRTVIERMAAAIKEEE